MKCKQLSEPIRTQSNTAEKRHARGNAIWFATYFYWKVLIGFLDKIQGEVVYLRYFYKVLMKESGHVYNLVCIFLCRF